MRKTLRSVIEVMANEKLFHIGIKALITNNEGEVLLLKVNPEILRDNKHGVYWDIPGGRIEKGHSIEEILRKEVQEETGITKISSTTFFSAVISNIEIPVENGSVGLALHIYKMAVTDDLEINLSNEHIEYGWFSKKEAAEKLKVKYPVEFTDKLVSVV